MHNYMLKESGLY